MASIQCQSYSWVLAWTTGPPSSYGLHLFGSSQSSQSVIVIHTLPLSRPTPIKQYTPPCLHVGLLPNVGAAAGHLAAFCKTHKVLQEQDAAEGHKVRAGQLL